MLCGVKLEDLKNKDPWGTIIQINAPTSYTISPYEYLKRQEKDLELANCRACLEIYTSMHAYPVLTHGR